ncbi:hypothetical protein [Psychroserpens sp. Hel_I_66]|uniref:hypothetical protein n=1 Tax=Psychroserpens sp. Hel_I_66 TaxID=1250004 RepID=UPI0012DFF579|nr:hypothetical protein [Psychroserpens sp. Hel_I_66]
MSSNSNLIYDAMVNYKQGDYKTAIGKWETLKANQPDNDTRITFRIAYLAIKKRK